MIAWVGSACITSSLRATGAAPSNEVGGVTGVGLADWRGCMRLALAADSGALDRGDEDDNTGTTPFLVGRPMTVIGLSELKYCP